MLFNFSCSTYASLSVDESILSAKGAKGAKKTKNLSPCRFSSRPLGFWRAALVCRFGRGQRLQVDRRQRRFLHDFDQAILGQFEQRQKGHDRAQLAFRDFEQAFEAMERAVAQLAQDITHALADRK